MKKVSLLFVLIAFVDAHAAEQLTASSPFPPSWTSILKAVKDIKSDESDETIALFKQFLNQKITTQSKISLKRSLNQKDFDPVVKKSPLLWSAFFLNSKVTDLLLQAGANPHRTDANYTNALLQALIKTNAASNPSLQSLKTIALLFNKNVNIFQCNHKDNCALYELAKGGHYKLFKTGMERYKQHPHAIPSYSHNSIPIDRFIKSYFFYSNNFSEEQKNYFIDCCVFLDQENIRSNNGNPAFVEFLLINNLFYDKTPEELALFRGCIARIIAAGVTIRDEYYFFKGSYINKAHCATIGAIPELLEATNPSKILLHEGNSYGETPLALLCTKSFINDDDEERYFRCATYLLEKGSPINRPTFQKETPLHLAVLSNNQGALKALLAWGNKESKKAATNKS